MPLIPEVLLLMWTTNIDLQMSLEMLELFAGEAKVSQAFREEGRSYASYDCIYGSFGPFHELPFFRRICVQGSAF